jgi:hypothetical protein
MAANKEATNESGSDGPELEGTPPPILTGLASGRSLSQLLLGSDDRVYTRCYGGPRTESGAEGGCCKFWRGTSNASNPSECLYDWLVEHKKWCGSPSDRGIVRQWNADQVRRLATLISLACAVNPEIEPRLMRVKTIQGFPEEILMCPVLAGDGLRVYGFFLHPDFSTTGP